MKTEYIIQTIEADKGGVYDFNKSSYKVIVNNEEWKYIATGLVREVYISVCGKKVVKIPKSEYGFRHNQLEYECYNEAPDWCKNNIAKTEVTEEGYIIQEFIEVIQADNYYRELGKRKSDGTIVIFDCDIFLNHKMEKPEYGFKYQQVFCKSKFWGEAYEKAREIPRLLRKKQQEAVKKYFPNIEKQSFRQLGDIVYIDSVEIGKQIADECGFTRDSQLNYDL